MSRARLWDHDETKHTHETRQIVAGLGRGAFINFCLWEVLGLDGKYKGVLFVGYSLQLASARGNPKLGNKRRATQWQTQKSRDSKQLIVQGEVPCLIYVSIRMRCHLKLIKHRTPKSWGESMGFEPTASTWQKFRLEMRCAFVIGKNSV